MSKIYDSITELVGHTPLVELKNYEKELGLKAHLLGKLEYFNPTGSVKDRVALNMIIEAEKNTGRCYFRFYKWKYWYCDSSICKRNGL